MQSFARVTSGLLSAQIGLYTTGHNISNASTDGYSRQRASFSDSGYVTLGYNGSGAMKLGLGSNLQGILQLRDEFLDKTYRKAVSKSSFHGVKETSISEIENILGELHGDSRLSNSINQLWSSLQELVTHPDGIETRSMFVNSAVAFMTKVNTVSKQLYDYQLTVNQEIIKSVNRINEITTQIEDLNKQIMLNEAAKDHANDLRDVRNNLIDELACYGRIDVKEELSGRVTILMEGKDLVANGTANLLGLQYCGSGYPFVKPVFNPSYVNDGKILDAAADVRPLFSNLDNAKISSANDNDYGSLKALMLVRGNAPANYTTPDSECQNYTIPKFQKELDTLVNKIVTMINDMLAPQDKTAPNAPYDLSDPPQQFIELFSRKYQPRYDAGGNYIPEDPGNPSTLYSMGNIAINSEILNNFNKLCLSATGDRGDTSVIEKMLYYWNGEIEDLDEAAKYRPGFGANASPLKFSDYYSQLVTRLGEEGSTSKVAMNAQNQILNDSIAARQQISGVALDEEMTEMMKFQHAYDAAARMVNVIDSMIDQIVNKLKA